MSLQSHNFSRLVNITVKSITRCTRSAVGVVSHYEDIFGIVHRIVGTYAVCSAGLLLSQIRAAGLCEFPNGLGTVPR